MRVGNILLFFAIFSVWTVVIQTKESSSTSCEACECEACSNALSSCAQSSKYIKEAAYQIIDNAQYFNDTIYKDMLIFFGATGSGKRTLAEVLYTPDKSKLLSVLNNDGNLSITSDVLQVSDPVTNFIPVLYKVTSRSEAVYTIPSLQKNDDEKLNIAAAYFTKKVFNNASKIKILITMPLYRLKSDTYKKQHLANLIHIAKIFNKYIKNFENSIALIVTIVDSNEDDKVKAEVAKYIESLKHLINKRENCLCNKEAANLHKLIEIITYQNSNSDFERIGLFKTPSKEGPLNLDIPFQTSLKLLQKVIDNNLQYKSISCCETLYVVYDYCFSKICEEMLEKSFYILRYFLGFFGVRH